MQERPARDKQSSLLTKFVDYGRKMLYEIGPYTWELDIWIMYCSGVNFMEIFAIVIY
jgi:hypothetical protein